MSKIGKQPIIIPQGIEVKIEGGTIRLKGEKGELTVPLLEDVEVRKEENLLRVIAKTDSKKPRSNWGTERSLVANAIDGLTKGFEKTLILEGIGYRIAREGNDLVFSLGFTHPITYKAPANITFEVEKNTILKIRGIDKTQVGQVAAEIRALRKPEPYKGKGFRYADEAIVRKAGKKAVAAGTK